MLKLTTRNLFTVVFTLCLSIALSTQAHAESKMIDRIVAIVDLTIITQSELDDRIEKIVSRSQAANVNLPPTKVLQDQVLDQLILETLQINTARRYGAEATDQEVAAAINNILQQRKWREEQLLQELKNTGETINEFKESMRKQITMQNIAQGVVSSRIKISEQDIDNFLTSADAKFWISPDFHLGHILIAVPQSADTQTIDASLEKANSIYEATSKGANFAEVAIAQSNGPAALEGGDLGWRKTTDLPTLFAEIAPTLAIGEVSKPARSQAGFHILKLYNKRGETKQIVTQTKARHILIKTSEIMSNEQAEAKLKEIRHDILNNGADFAEKTKEYSDDIASKLSGGDLGWSNPGQFVPAFEKVMHELPVGEISEPFLSKFGWHILQVEGRRDEDLTQDVIRNRARSLLINRRFEDEVQVWLQEMKDDAFIEIKI